MSGIVGHTFYAVLGLKAAGGRKLPLANLPAGQGPSRSEITAAWKG